MRDDDGPDAGSGEDVGPGNVRRLLLRSARSDRRFNLLQLLARDARMHGRRLENDEEPKHRPQQTDAA